MVRDASVDRQYERGSKDPYIVFLLLGLLIIAFASLLIFALLFPQLVPPQVAGLLPPSTTSAEPATPATTAKPADKTPATDNQTKEQDAMNLTLSQLFSTGSVQTVRLVGDSITAGFLTDGYKDSDLTYTGAIVYDDGEETHYESGHDAICWANEFRSFATAHGTEGFVNAGINGAFMNRLSNHPDAWLGNGADVVFVALGTNDAGYYSAKEFRQSAIEGLAAAAKACKTLVVLSPVTDLRSQDTLVVSPQELGEVLRQICEENGYVFVDMSQSVSPDQFQNDGLHPTSEGSLAMWQHIVDVLQLEE